MVQTRTLWSSKTTNLRISLNRWISIEIQLIKTKTAVQLEWIKWWHSLFVNSLLQLGQQSLFWSNLARLNDDDTSLSVVVASYQCCLTYMADRKPNLCIVKWILFTCYLNNPPFGRAAFNSTPGVLLSSLERFRNTTITDTITYRGSWGVVTSSFVA